MIWRPSWLSGCWQRGQTIRACWASLSSMSWPWWLWSSRKSVPSATAEASFWSPVTRVASKWSTFPHFYTHTHTHTHTPTHKRCWAYFFIIIFLDRIGASRRSTCLGAITRNLVKPLNPLHQLCQCKFGCFGFIPRMFFFWFACFVCFVCLFVCFSLSSFKKKTLPILQATTWGHEARTALPWVHWQCCTLRMFRAEHYLFCTVIVILFFVCVFVSCVSYFGLFYFICLFFFLFWLWNYFIIATAHLVIFSFFKKKQNQKTFSRLRPQSEADSQTHARIMAMLEEQSKKELESQALYERSLQTEEWVRGWADARGGK